MPARLFSILGRCPRTGVGRRRTAAAHPAARNIAT